MESDYNTFEVMWQYWREKKKTNGYEYGGCRVGNCSNHKKYKEMSIKFKNVPISDKKKNPTKNGVNLFFFKKFLYIIAIDGVKKNPTSRQKCLPTLRLLPAPSWPTARPAGWSGRSRPPVRIWMRVDLTRYQIILIHVINDGRICPATSNMYLN